MSLHQLVLASQSPRRRELLAILGVSFTVIPSQVEETQLEGEIPREYVKRVAREKGVAVADRLTNAVVLSADTIVVVDEELLGKPADVDDAIRILELLSWREHSVLTAVSVIDSNTDMRQEGIEKTRVWFRELDRKSIEDYIHRENVMDKAGAYAIQGLASRFVTRIDGSYSNIVGLPVALVYTLCKKAGLLVS